MPVFDVTKPIDNALLSSIIYGGSRAGKTVLGASCPKVALICSEREGGYTSVQTMDRGLWYEPNVPPLVYVVGKLAETKAYVDEILRGVKQGRIQTVVVELTFYSDDIIRAGSSDKNGWQVYRNLEDHILWLDNVLRPSGVRRMYNALAADPGDVATKVPAGLLLAGKALARKFPAQMDLYGYLTLDLGDRALHLTQFGAYPAGHRYGSLLPKLIRNPTFRKMEDLIQGRAVCDPLGNVKYGTEADALRAAAVPAAGAAIELPTLDGALPALEEELPDLTASA